MKQVTIGDIEQFIDQGSTIYKRWNIGDCSLVGIIKVLLIQELRRECKDPWYQVDDRLLKELMEWYPQ